MTCRRCGTRMRHTWKYYLLIFVCAVLGSQASNIMQALFGLDSALVSLVFIVPVVLILVAAAWQFVPGLIAAESDRPARDR